MAKTDFKPEYALNRCWYLAVYDVQGGPVPPQAIQALDSFAEKIAKQYNLAVSSEIATR
jgi:hypothetical protein